MPKNQHVQPGMVAQAELEGVGSPDDNGGVISLLLSDGDRWGNGHGVKAPSGMYLLHLHHKARSAVYYANVSCSS